MRILPGRDGQEAVHRWAIRGVSAGQLAAESGYLDIARAEGAQLASGGERLGGGLAGGYSMPPTVLAGVNNEMRVAPEEIVGPVACVIPFDTVEDAIRLGTPRAGGGTWTSICIPRRSG